MAEFISTINSNLKRSSESATLLILKIYSGLMLGLVFSLVGEEIIGYGTLSFTFIVVTFTAFFLKIAKSWGWTFVLVFDLVCVLIGLLLRMYILVAPGA